MIIKDDVELDIAFNFRIDGFGYVVFATTGRMRCLCCGKEGHLVCNCPDQSQHLVSGGVAILFSKNFSPVSYEVHEIVKGRLLKIKAKFDMFVFVFIYVYVPTAAIERLSFLGKLCETVQGCS